MGKKKKSLAAIDLGAYSAKILSGITEGALISLNHAVKIPIPEETYDDGQIRKPDTLREVLKGSLHENRIVGVPTVFTVESSMCVIREMTLPTVKPKDLRDMISYEIQNYLPIDLSQYVVQSKIMGEAMEGSVKQTNVMVAALPKDIVESHLALLESIGLKPYALDIHANSQCKLLDGTRKVNQGLETRDITLAVIDIGHRQINLNIIEKGHYRFNRLLNYGSRDIDASITNFIGNTRDEARIQKTSIPPLSREVSDDTEIARVHNLCRSSVDGWLEEIERIFKFYYSRSTGNKIDHILLTGGGARMNGIDGYIKKSIGIDTEILQVVENAKLVGATSELDLSKFTNALGAMIRL